MIAASAVIVSHSYPLSLGFGTVEPLKAFVGSSLGNVAVKAFFAISGYFVYASFERRRSNADFVIARASRIYPGLIAVSLLSMFVLGPIFTSLPAATYLSHPDTWLYILKTCSFLDGPADLPGVFSNNPQDPGVNGSLWTLYYEVACYLGLFLAGVYGFLRSGRFAWLLLGYIPIYLIVQYSPARNYSLYSMFSLPFMIGMMAYHYRSARFLRSWIAMVLLACALLSSALHFPIQEFWSGAIAYGALCLGFARAPGLLPYNRLGDYSYGMYIYGWPIQQALVAALPDITPGAMTLATLPLALCCGILSWHFVERPGLRLRQYAQRRATRRAADPQRYGC
jgi:peptidoglycan/LPS O-acetylase OafA/YrhL